MTGTVLHNQPLAGCLPLHAPYSESHGILYRNNKEGRQIFNMLVKRGYDAGLRIESKNITTRAMLIEAIDACKRLDKYGLDQIIEWSCANLRHS